MLIRIENQPLSYAWGSKDAMAKLLGSIPTGEPQAELWMGTHPGSPSKLSRAAGELGTLSELIAQDATTRGIEARPMSFLFKVLAIGSPLSLQVHPNLEQAQSGFRDEESRGVPRDSPVRNYKDSNHKPELLVAVTEVEALAGFQSLEQSRAIFTQLAAAIDGPASDIFAMAAGMCVGDAAVARRSIIEWALDPRVPITDAVSSLSELMQTVENIDGLSALRVGSLKRLSAAYPRDPGVLIACLLNIVLLKPGEAVFLAAGQIHSYQSGLAVEVMASSDNVLRCGLTPKHVDAAELCKITDFADDRSPRFASKEIVEGLVNWSPDIRDFQLYRAHVSSGLGEPDDNEAEAAESIDLEAPNPMVVFVTRGSVRVERCVDGVMEIARLTRGQSLYAAPGADITIRGSGEAFIATAGNE